MIPSANPAARPLCAALLFGGLSSEHEVSRVSAVTFAEHMDPERYELIKIGITKEGRWLYTEATSAQMADGSWEQLPGNMPCVLSPDRADHGAILFTPSGHCGVLASAVCMDKAVANALFACHGIPHCAWAAYTRAQLEADPAGIAAHLAETLGWPIFVKPANAGSSVGVTKAGSPDELARAIQVALENDRKVVFESFVDGQEVECAVIGSEPAAATRPGEILAGAEFYTYDDKYKNGVSQTVIPARLPEEKLDEVKELAARAYTALGCEGLARCDFFVERGTGRVLINEINTMPGFTSISMYPKLMEHEGTPLPQLIDRLIALAMERPVARHG